MTKLEAFSKYMSQFAAHRGADMQYVMEQSSHGRLFDYAWEEATKMEREACAKEVEDEIKRVKPVYSVTAENALKAIRARGEK